MHQHLVSAALFGANHRLRRRADGPSLKVELDGWAGGPGLIKSRVFGAHFCLSLGRSGVVDSDLFFAATLLYRASVQRRPSSSIT